MQVETAQLEERFETLVGVLRWRAQARPERQAVSFEGDDTRTPVELSYAELDRRARAVAAFLQEHSAYGERALLVYPPGLDFVVAFFGCLYAGIVAVPAHPPRRQTLHRLNALAIDARPAVALTTSSIAATLEPALTVAPALARLEWKCTDTLPAALADAWVEPEVTSDSLAFLQYTSGSTATPKGVAVSHRNIIHNSSLIKQCFAHTAESRGVIWLPPHHDMGLIGGVVQPIYSGFRVTLVSPLAFLQQPLRWLDAISRTRATTSGAPNFAYDLCARKISAQQIANLDLSCWDVAFTGAEPIRAETLDRFVTKFEPCGFRREAFYPCYGLAEATLFVTGGMKRALPVTETVRASALEDGRVTAAQPGSADARTLVSCGRAWADQRVAIVDPETSIPRAPGHVGEIWVAGLSVAEGYWNRPAESELVFRARMADSDDRPWLRTGDLGYLSGGELFFVSRLKDLIIIDGRNHYPEDIEQLVEASHEHLRPHGCAAFSVDEASEERLVVVAEVDSTVGENGDGSVDVDAVKRSVRRAVADGHGVYVHAVVLVRRGSVPRTTSGKVRRQSCRQHFLAGRLKIIGGA